MGGDQRWFNSQKRVARLTVCPSRDLAGCQAVELIPGDLGGGDGAVSDG